MKICSRCGIEKDKSEFRVRKERPCGFRSQCRKCDGIYDKKYQKTPEGRSRHLMASHRYQKTAKGIAADRRYRLSDKWQQTNQFRSRCRRERAYNFDYYLTNEDIKIIYSRFEYQCFNCGNINNLEIDHHYPLSRGYGLILSNTVLLCRSCNASKHNKMPENFYTPKQLEKLNAILK